MSTIHIDLDESVLARFQTPAALLGIKPEEAAKLSIEEFLAKPDHEFETIVSEIIEDHRDALERLAR
jgi:hypothetical protein